MAAVVKTPGGSVKTEIRKRGRILKTKTFTRKTAARIEVDSECVEALGHVGGGLLLPSPKKPDLSITHLSVLRRSKLTQKALAMDEKTYRSRSDSAIRICEMPIRTHFALVNGRGLYTPDSPARRRVSF